MTVAAYNLPNWPSQILLIAQSCLLYFTNLMEFLSKLLDKFFIVEATMVQGLQKIFLVNIFEMLKLVKSQIFKFLELYNKTLLKNSKKFTLEWFNCQ